jgi:uncharacterized membrane protein
MMIMLLGMAAVVVAAVYVVYAAHRHAAGHAPHPQVPVLDARAERAMRSRYLTGQISIDVYLDRTYGTTYSSAGNRGPAG